MQNKKGHFILIVAVVGLTIKVEALSSKRVVLNLDKVDVHPIEGKRNDIESSKDALNGQFEENGVMFGINRKSKSVMENMYFKIFESHMDRFFKRYEDEMRLRKLSTARGLSVMNKKTNNIVQNKENNDDRRVSDNESSETGFNNSNLDKETYVKNKRNTNNNRKYLTVKLLNNLGKFKNDYKELYSDQSYNEYFENNALSSNEYLSSEENNFITDEENYNESKDSDNEIKEGEESEEFFERNDEDRKNKEFGVFDYLVASKESVENNINPKDDGKFKHDDDFIPDDYFDNSDYEA